MIGLIVRDAIAVCFFTLVILGFIHGMRRTGITTFRGIFAGIREHLKDPYNAVMDSDFFSESRTHEQRTLAVIISIGVYVIGGAYYIPWCIGVSIQVLIAKFISRSVDNIEREEARNR